MLGDTSEIATSTFHQASNRLAKINPMRPSEFVLPVGRLRYADGVVNCRHVPLLVLIVRMGQQPHERPLMTSSCQERQMLTYLQVRCSRRDGFEIPTNFGRCFGLHIERIVLKKLAGKKDVNGPYLPGRRPTSRLHGVLWRVQLVDP